MSTFPNIGRLLDLAVMGIAEQMPEIFESPEFKLPLCPENVCAAIAEGRRRREEARLREHRSTYYMRLPASLRQDDDTPSGSQA